MSENEAPFAVRCEWGERGIAALAADSDCIVIVDILSFSTSVEIAAARGATIIPIGLDEDAEEAADALGAELALPRQAAAGGNVRSFSLSPASMQNIRPGSRLVLPSLNGSALSVLTGSVPTIAGSLRNASAVARAAAGFGPRVAVIPAGERWPDRSLRPAIEDLLGAGAIIAHLGGDRSPEADTAVDAFRAAGVELPTRIRRSQSGLELTEMGFIEDIQLATEHDVSVVVPVLRDGAYAARRG